MAKTVETLAVKMVLDATGVTDSIGATAKEINEAERIINSTRTPLERLEEKERRLQELMAKGAVDDIPKFQRAMESLRRSKEDLANATQKQASADARSVVSQQQVIQKLSVLGDLVKYHVIARGVSFVSNAFRDVATEIGNAQKRLDELGDRASRLGVTAEALQRLRIQADLSDVSFESLTGGMEKLFIKTADAAMGNQDLQKTFAMLGLNVGELMQMDQAAQFGKVAESIGNIADRSTRLSIIADLFGRGNTELIAFIDNQNKMQDTIDATKSVMSEQQIAQIGEADQAMKILMHSLEGVFNVAAAELAPAIAQVANELSKFLQEDVNTSELVTGLIYLGEILKQMPAEAKGWMDWLKGGLEEMFKNTQIGEDMKEAARQAGVVAQSQIDARRQQERASLRNALDEAGVGFAGSETLEQLREMAKEVENKKRAEESMAQAQRMAAEQSEQTFATERQQLENQIELLKTGTNHIQEQKDAKAGYNAEQVDFLSGLREEKAALEAIKFAEEEDIKLKKERVSEAENIRQSLRSAEDAASDRLARAMDLVTTGELQQSDFDKMLEKEAAALSRGGRDVKLSATAFGSQAAIAATMGNQQSDSERLESIKQSLLELVKKPAVEVEEVGAI